MNFENWNGAEVLYENDDSYYSDSDDSYYSDSDDSYQSDSDESRRRGGVRNARGVRGRPMSPGFHRPYRGTGQIDTPAGKAKVNLPDDLVRQGEFRELEKKVLANNKAILDNSKAIGVLNSNTKRLDDGLARLGKSLDENTKKIGGIQQGQMFSALMPPKLTEVTFNKSVFDATKDVSDTNPKVDTVKSAKFDMMTTLLPLMVSGGMGGSSSSSSSKDGNNNMGMMLPMILLMNNNNSGSSGSSDNTMMILVMMMMMNK